MPRARGPEPDSAWYQVVKWQALAARQVARETGIATIWSWGWSSYGAAALTEKKEGAACVYLWTRDPGLCDARTLAASARRRSRAGRSCSRKDGTAARDRGIDVGPSRRSSALTGDREVALTALLARASESPYAGVPTARC